MSKNNPEWFELSKESWIELNESRDRIYRDSQRQRLYDAEYFFRYMNEVDNPQFDSIQGISDYVNRIVNSAWFIKRWGKPLGKIGVYENRGGCWASRYRGIHLAKWGWNKVVVLHELSHVLTISGVPSHGRYFARTILEIIGHEMGSQARELLKESYRRNKVRFHPKHQLSPEALEKMREIGRNNLLVKRSGV